MKKKILTALMCLTLVLGSSGLASCDKQEDEELDDYSNVYKISQLLVYDRLAGQFDLTGQEVRLENVVVTSTHGNTITVSEADTTTAIEVVLSEESDPVVMMTLVNVTGTMNTYHGRAQITDAIVETVNSSQQSFYYTTGFTKSSGFDYYGRTDSGIIGGGITANGLDPVKFRVISYNGATEFKAGEDLLITVAYQGTDYSDSYNWLDLVLFGDSDQSVINYYNAFFFGTDTTVSWSSPFSTGRSDRLTIAAGYEGIEEGEYFTCQLIHFFYDEVYNPDYGCMFFLDDVCLPYADKLALYNEESALGNAFAALADAFDSEDETQASYTTKINWLNKEGAAITEDDLYTMTNSEYNAYLRNLTDGESEDYTINATPTYYSVEYSYESEVEGESEYGAEILYNYTDDDNYSCVADIAFDSSESLNAFITCPSSFENLNDAYYEGYDVDCVWTDLVHSLYEMSEYSHSFHQTGSTCLYNDDSINDALWNCTDGYVLYYSNDWIADYGESFTLESLTYSSSTQTLKSVYTLGAWYYADASYNYIQYIQYYITNTTTFNFTVES